MNKMIVFYDNKANHNRGEYVSYMVEDAKECFNLLENGRYSPREAIEDIDRFAVYLIRSAADLEKIEAVYVPHKSLFFMKRGYVFDTYYAEK